MATQNTGRKALPLLRQARLETVTMSEILSNSRSYFTMLKHEPLTFLPFPLTTTFLAIYLWTRFHQLLDPNIWLNGGEFPQYDFLTPGPYGRAFELIIFVLVAVQIRWVGNIVLARKSRIYSFSDVLGLWVFDCISMPLIIWILLSLLQTLTINLAGGFSVSLADADAVLYGVICAILALFTKNTRVLLRRLTDSLFKNLHDGNENAEDI